MDHRRHQSGSGIPRLKNRTAVAPGDRRDRSERRPLHHAPLFPFAEKEMEASEEFRKYIKKRELRSWAGGFRKISAGLSAAQA